MQFVHGSLLNLSFYQNKKEKQVTMKRTEFENYAAFTYGRREANYNHFKLLKLAEDDDLRELLDCKQRQK